MKRRTFIQTTAAAAAAASIPIRPRRATALTLPPPEDPGWLHDAVQSAMDAGARYAEVLYRGSRSETIQLRKEDITTLESDAEAGICMRVFYRDAWGTAAVSAWEPGRPDRLAGAAVASAEQLSALRTQQFDPSTRQNGGTHNWSAPLEIDPFSVSPEEKISFLRNLTSKALTVTQIPFAVANLFLRRSDTTLVTSRDAEIRQSAVFTYPNFAVTAFHQKLRRMDTRSSSLEAQAAGWEITKGSMNSDLETAMQEVLQLQGADPVTQGSYDLVVHPTMLWNLLYDTLLPHLDPRRVMNIDGQRPGDRWIGPDQLAGTAVGSSLLTLRADSSLRNGLASCGWDDSGRIAPAGTLVQGGNILRLPWDGTLPPIPNVKVLGCSRSAGWSIPASVAMPDIVLDPAEGGSISDLVSSVDNGLLVKGRGSVLMNPAKTMFRVRPQVAWMIRGGKIAEVVRGVEIETSVQQFWQALDGLSGAGESITAGDLFPGRSSALWEVPFSVSVPAGLFRRIPVYTAQEAR